MPCVGVAIGGDDVPGQWDDELSSWPEERRHVAARRIAFFTTVAGLVTLIILTIVFVGNDKTSSARVSTNETSSSTLSTIGFATSLPVAATATSLSDPTTTTTTSTTLQSTTTAPATTTTTAPLPPFKYNGQTPKFASGTFSSGDPACQPSTEQFRFNTPSPGTLTILRLDTGITATGPVSPSNVSERYVGNTTQAGASVSRCTSVASTAPHPGGSDSVSGPAGVEPDTEKPTTRGPLSS